MPQSHVALLLHSCCYPLLPFAHPFSSSSGFRMSLDPQIKPDWLEKSARLVESFLLIWDGSKPWYVVNPKIAGFMDVHPTKNVSIGIDPYPSVPLKMCFFP